MPLYEIRCTRCNDLKQVFRPVSLRDNLPDCVCEGTFERLIAAPRISKEITPYKSPATGKIISSRSEQKEDLRRAGCRLYEPGMKEDIARNAVSAQEKSFAPVAAAIDQTVASLVSAGKLEP